MSEGPKRYADLPHTARAFLEQLTEEQIVQLIECSSFCRNLSTPARKFLTETPGTTLHWLMTRREEEIKQLDEAIKLVVASRTLGRFASWVFWGAISSFVALYLFGETLMKAFRGVK